ncbi:MAG TPA: DUF2076 domain-containing protein [Roseiarcus sp.]|nr:DUF2076 domain-containing protein [Roseiarcus sp.]
MTPQERQLLGGLFQRIASTASNSRDPEAENFISEAVRMQPHAPYVLAQTVLVQQQALEAAAKRVQELEAQIQGQNPPEQQEGSFLGNLGRSLFGGGQSAPPAPRSNYDASAYTKGSSAPPPGPQQAYPQQNYGPPPGAGPWGAPPSSGGGFLHNALTTAAGVAGGMMAADALRGMFGGHAYGLGGGYGLGGVGGETVVNNYYENADPAGQQAQDTLQDMDQDQDDLQDAADDSGFDDGGNDNDGSFDT